MSEMTRAHIQRVASLLVTCIKELADKAQTHDASKLGPFEKPIFDKYEGILKGLNYGSPEYKKALAEMKPALDHHYAENRHHPEHFGVHGISGMTLIDLVEMLCDWAAAVQRHHNGNLVECTLAGWTDYRYQAMILLRHHSSLSKDVNIITHDNSCCKVSTERHATGSLPGSIEHNQKRFGYSDDLKSIFANTAAFLEGK